jgi:hypothetical protein
LERKDAEELERLRVEEDIARKLAEELEQKQQKRLAREAEEHRKKLCRIRAVAKRKQKFALEIQGPSSGDKGTTPISKAALVKAMATYGGIHPVSAQRVRWGLRDL